MAIVALHLPDSKSSSPIQSALADNPAIPAGVRKSPVGYLVIEDTALLNPHKKAGFKVEVIPLKNPKSSGGRYQENVFDSDSEWRITSPSGVVANIDGIASDAANPKVSESLSLSQSTNRGFQIGSGEPR